MSGDKRVVTTDALETLGTIHTSPQYRDAIHLAVEPVVAAHHMCPGADVVVENGVAHHIYHGTRIGRGEGMGIVDPFIKADVIEPGQPVWFLLYPRQVHSLRHVWTHPAFPDSK